MEYAPIRPGRFRPGTLVLVYILLFSMVVVLHSTLLRLPYFWDEGGYYVPAALDFYHRHTLIPTFTNAHPPLPSIVLGAAWHLFGLHIVVTRVVACAFAAGGLTAIYELGRRLQGQIVAIAVTVLTAVYPIWFAQSSLAHADIFAVAFSLAGLAMYLPAPELQQQPTLSQPGRLIWAAGWFCLSVLAKETAIVQPLALLLGQAGSLWKADPLQRRGARRWSLVFTAPVPVLTAWFLYHRAKTGFTFGNPEFLRYNAVATFTVRHVLQAFCYRFLHLFWQRSIWVPLVLAAGCLLLPRQRTADPSLPRAVLRTVALLVAANWLAFSILGGALLTRYLLPVYPLLLLVAVSVWREHVGHWPWLALLTAGVFVAGWWLNPPTYFAPEDNLTYRDMIVVHQEAAVWLQVHIPQATVLTAWPASAELSRPELGYTHHVFRTVSLDNFTAAQVARAATEPERFDTALVFSTHYVTPAYQQFLLSHPGSHRGREYLQHRDLSPEEIAAILGGQIAWQDDRDGEWAAILRFPRSYEALETPSCSGPVGRRARC